MELTILMPCLNEAETLTACIRKAQHFLGTSGVHGEVLISDNGSTDDSVSIAENLGARVVYAHTAGYGAAIMRGIRDAKGKYVIIGDADDSYDFQNLGSFIESLRAGNDLVMGNRFRGHIATGAMPALHRYLGNPVLSFIGRLFFGIAIGDFHCGLRGFNRDKILGLDLHTTGMEFASEMVVRASLHHLSITEVPVSLSPDGRSRKPHLRTWRDGWRHLRFLLIYSPRWLFLYPGLAIFAVGAALTLVLLPGPVQVAPHVVLDIHSLIVACLSMLIGLQAISFAVIARRYSAARNLIPRSGTAALLENAITLERALGLAAIVFVGGLGGLFFCVRAWWHVNMGTLPYGYLLRVLTLSVTCIAMSLQVMFSAFLSEILSIGLSGDRTHTSVRARDQGRSLLTHRQNQAPLQNQAQLEYSGHALLLQAEADLRHYNEWVATLILRHARDRRGAVPERLLEFGAGIGTLASLVSRKSTLRPDTVEVDPRQRQILADRGFWSVGSLEELLGPYDVIYTSNVLEHIQDDDRVLCRLKDLLSPGGRLLIYVPAFPHLWTSLDDHVGHYRRYTKRSLTAKLRTAGYQIDVCHYCDSLGYMLAIIFRLFSRSSRLPTSFQLRVFDRLIFPLSKISDGLFHNILGKNLFVVASPIHPSND